MRAAKSEFITSTVGQQATFAEALSSGLFQKEGMTAFESVFIHDYEDLIYQLSLVKTINI